MIVIKQKINCTIILINSEFNRNSGIVSIGRGSEAILRIKNHSLSRIQCRLQYKEDKWILTDGDGAKKSTNGTWLYIEEAFKIYDNMIFKACTLLFKAYLHD